MSSATNAMHTQFWQASIKELMVDGGRLNQKWQVSSKQSLEGL